jgi:two-component system chemotaxis response regulator CheY
MSETVLIVDDADFMRLMLKEMLQDMGLAVAGEAGDGEQAIALYESLRPDLVLLDITMPRKDGIQTLKEILARDPEARIVMITALGQKDKVIESIQAGALDFVVKPFDQDRVHETVVRVLHSEKVAWS